MTSTTTQQLTTAIREHHRALADSLDGYLADVESGIGGLDGAALTGLLDKLTSFLSGELLPHAQGEERTLYPALDPILREHGRPTATMSVDHEYIGEYARQIAATAASLRSSSASERVALERRLERQLTQLQGLFSVHLAKEERVYLPLVEEVISAGDQQALLNALHEEAEGDTRNAAEPLDVRTISPAQRHPLIFQRFEALPIGGSFTLVNDHDPKPLRYQLVAEYTGELLWEYLEQGPAVWRVRIGKAS